MGLKKVEKVHTWDQEVITVGVGTSDLQILNALRYLNNIDSD